MKPPLVRDRHDTRFGVDPGVDLVRVEAQRMTPLDEGDAALLDEAADVPLADAEVLGDCRQVHERPALGDGGGSHVGVLLLGSVSPLGC